MEGSPDGPNLRPKTSLVPTWNATRNFSKIYLDSVVHSVYYAFCR